MGELFATFAEIAHSNPFAAWDVPSYSPGELVAASPHNRWIADPYPIHLVARDQVNNVIQRAFMQTLTQSRHRRSHHSTRERSPSRPTPSSTTGTGLTMQSSSARMTFASALSQRRHRMTKLRLRGYTKPIFSARKFKSLVTEIRTSLKRRRLCDFDQGQGHLALLILPPQG